MSSNDRLLPIINIIGAGNLGKTLGKLIHFHSAGVVQGIWNTSSQNSKNAIEFIGAGHAFKTIKDLPPCDITFITVADQFIENCCQELAESKRLQTKSIIVHCSGSLTSNNLHAAKAKGCFVCSVHPMKSFAVPSISITQFTGTYCAIEGDDEAKKIVSKLFDNIEAITYEILSSKKEMYHAAGVIAANYTVTIYNAALQCLKDAAGDDAMAKKIILSLMDNTLINLEKTSSSQEALTGPIKRGDSATIKNNLNSLVNNKFYDLYKALGIATLEIATLSQQKKDEILEILLKK